MSSGRQDVQLFINYRREDTAPYAGRLYDRLSAKFGSDQVFIDIDQIEPGEDFVEAIHRKVGACETAIVLLGPDWLHVTDASGQRRLNDPEDFVRMEIVAALQRKIRVIPVLVGGAQMPRKQDLPEPLAALSRRNAIELSEARFHADVDRLIEAIEKPRTSPEKKTEAPVREPALMAQPVTQSDDASRNRTNRLRMAIVVIAATLVVGWLVWAGRRHRSLPTASTGPAAQSVGSTATPNDFETFSSASSPISEVVSTSAAQNSETPLTVITQNPLEPSVDDMDLDASVIEAIRNSAELGSPEDQLKMGAFYEFGLKLIPKDLNEAAKWYRKAAAQGHALAQQGWEDLSRNDASPSSLEEIQLESRRISRMQVVGSIVLNDLDEKARRAIKNIKP